MPQCLPSTPSDQQLLFLLKLSQWRPSSLRGQMGEVFSDLPQQTSPSLFYNMRAPPRYWIATATDMVEPRGPDSGQHVGIEGDFRGRSGSVVIDESRKETQHAGSAQILDCSSPTYLNRHCRAYSTTCGLRPDIGLLPQRTWSSLGGQIRVSMSESKATSVGALAVSSSTSPGRKHHMRAPPRYWIATATDIVEPRRPDSGQHVGTEGDCRGRSGTGVIDESRMEKDNEINEHVRAEAKAQPNTSR